MLTLRPDDNDVIPRCDPVCHDFNLVVEPASVNRHALRVSTACPKPNRNHLFCVHIACVLVFPVAITGRPAGGAIVAWERPENSAKCLMVVFGERYTFVACDRDEDLPEPK